MNPKTKKFTIPFNKDSKWASLVIVIGVALYSMFYPVLTATFGTGVVFWIVAPVMLVGWFYGIRAGLAASAAGLVLSIVLLHNTLNDWGTWIGHYLWGGFF